MIGDIAKLPDGAVDWRFMLACNGAAEPVVTIDDLYDIAEVQDVGRSWADAQQANMEIAG